MTGIHRRVRPLVFITCFAVASACGGGGGDSSESTRPLPPSDPGDPPPAPVTPPTQTSGFSNVTPASGIGFEVGFTRDFSHPDVTLNVPSGAAAGDYDNDGLIDLVIVRGDVGPNLLYRNLGGLAFEEVAAEAGIAWPIERDNNFRHGSPGLADLDGDGDLDLFLPGLGNDPSLLYRNNGDGTFTDVTPGSGLDLIQAEFSFSPAFGDYDLDGDLDLLLAHWGTPKDQSGDPVETEHLWRNDTDEVGILFTPVTLESGIAPSILTLVDPLITLDLYDYSFAPSFARINEDAYPDILMVADFNHTQVFHNRQDGQFTNVTDVDVIVDGNGMGSALGDYDFDGDLDWFVSSILTTTQEEPLQISTIGNRLYRNDAGTFVDVTDEAGVADGGWGWGSCFMDFENDGDLDIYHTNGWREQDEDGEFARDLSRAFVSDGEGKFEERASELRLNDPYEGRGVVCADFDRDGDTDILLLHTSTSESATLWRNDTDGNNYLAITLRGEAPNTGAVGARIRIQSGGREQMREVNLASNYASHNPTDQLFGLGTANRVESLTVEWPDGSETFMRSLEVNQRLSLEHPRL